jgi:uncharacterized protein (DUF2141 family)
MKHIIWLIIILASCAQFIPPTGGEKDKVPPELVATYPANKTKNYKGATISLSFNELIDASALRQELIITPQPKGAFDLKEKPYGIELKFDKPFNDSTTYTFNFRNGVKDLNEKNPAKNLKLVFSTGSEIDSLTFSGTIKDLFSGEPANDVTVGLYDLSDQTDTIPLLKTKPSYFIKTDSSGKYNFENLKYGKYRVLAFKDENLNLLYDSKNEQFGFIPDTIRLDTSTNEINFNVYPNNIDEPKIRRTLARQEYFLINYTKPLQSAKVQFPDKVDSLTYKLIGDELRIFPHPNPKDTTLTNIIVQDSVGNKFEHEQKIYFIKQRENATKKIETLIVREDQIKTRSKIKLPTSYKFDFETPIATINEEKITILSDSLVKEKFQLVWIDSSKTKLEIKVIPKAKKEIAFRIDSGAITNYKSDTNSTYTLINTIYQQDEYGSIDGTYDEFQGQKIAELIDVEKNKIIDYQIFTDKFTFQQVIPSNYKIRIIEDKNQNGKWDTGSFEKNQLPERVIISKGIIKLKANFQLNDIRIQ